MTALFSSPDPSVIQAQHHKVREYTRVLYITESNILNRRSPSPAPSRPLPPLPSLSNGNPRSRPLPPTPNDAPHRPFGHQHDPGM